MNKFSTQSAIGAGAPRSTVMAGSITTKRFFSAVLQRNWSYNIYLPANYDTSDSAYPVIYLLHGNGGNEASWDEGMRVIDGLIQAGKLRPIIAVAPASGSSWWVDTLEPFETATIRDLAPHIDTAYRTVKERGGRALAGFSMGGYGALRYVLTYPEVFSTATVLSPAIYDRQPPSSSSARISGAFGFPYDPDLWTRLNYPAALTSYKSLEFEVPVFIAAGDGDWNEPEGWQYNVEYQSVLLYEQLNKDAGSPAALRIASGGHDWRFWKPMFVEGLSYMISSLGSIR